MNNSEKTALRNRVLKLRRVFGSYESLARKLYVSYATVWRWANGKISRSPHELQMKRLDDIEKEVL